MRITALWKQTEFAFGCHLPIRAPIVASIGPNFPISSTHEYHRAVRRSSLAECQYSDEKKYGDILVNNCLKANFMASFTHSPDATMKVLSSKWLWIFFLSKDMPHTSFLGVQIRFIV